MLAALPRQTGDGHAAADSKHVAQLKRRMLHPPAIQEGAVRAPQILEPVEALRVVWPLAHRRSRTVSAHDEPVDPGSSVGERAVSAAQMFRNNDFPATCHASRP